jgi:threonine dehydrogenase-like Zn-dependent dehydrogenase
MKVLAWHGKGDIRCEEVPDPKIEQPRDAIIKVTACAICGSDLHVYGGIIPDMKKGDVLGHENMGEVTSILHSWLRIPAHSKPAPNFTRQDFPRQEGRLH